MSKPRTPSVSALCACALVLLGALPARADDNPLERAMKLRNEAGTDWNQKRYADAASKLRKALDIYAAVDGERPLDRAITYRALTWNLVRAGDTAGALASFEALLDLVAVDEGVYGEVDSAWGALWEAASAVAGFTEGRTLLDAVREAAAKRSLDRLAAQVVHSTGSLAAKHKEVATAASLFREAVALRRKIGDAQGEVWSLNNLANLHLVNDGLSKALAPLREAHALAHRERVAAPQQAIAWNVRKALEGLTASPDNAGVEWLLALGTTSTRSSFGAVLPPGYLERRALALAGMTGQDKLVYKTASTLAKARMRKDVPALAADLTIRAARAACDSGKVRQARGWLKKLDLGEGPCRPQLDARWKTARAIASTDKRAQKDFPAIAREAALAWRTLGDFRGRIEGLAALVAAARAAGLEGTISEIVAESEEAARQGGPGGDGGSAMSGGDRSKARDLPLDGVLFRIAVREGRIAIEDVAAGHATTQALRWKPSRIGLNGLVLLFFGGYVVVESLHYGGATSANAAPGATTLDALGAYLPLPARGALVVQKNGAVRYETATVSPR